jgi:hypothetical protein
MTTPPPERRGRLGLWIGLGAAVVVAAAGAALYLDSRGGGEPRAVAATTAAPSPTIDQAAVVECTNIQRAYTAWKGSAYTPPANTGAVYSATKFDVEGWMADGKALYEASRGYESKPSKAFVVAVTTYNLSMSMVNVEVTLSGEVGQEAALKVVDDAAKVHAAYSVYWLERRCGKS